jgi:hypothetical protein
MWEHNSHTLLNMPVACEDNTDRSGEARNSHPIPLLAIWKVEWATLGYAQICKKRPSASPLLKLMHVKRIHNLCSLLGHSLVFTSYMMLPKCFALISGLSIKSPFIWYLTLRSRKPCFVYF